MSFFGKVKQATGIGLNGAGSYHRAYEKGVLMGDRQAGVTLFREAAAKLDREGDTALAARARANAALYAFLIAPSTGQLQPLRDALAAVTEIEQIDSETAFMPAEPLVRELEVRILESRLVDAPPLAAAAAHRAVLAALEPMLDRPLLLYRLTPLPNEGPLVETATSRHYWHQGMAAHHTALATLPANPAEAANHAIGAAQAFQLCGDQARQAESEQMARALQVRRTCWICHREMQGLGTHIKWYASTVTSYVTDLLQRPGQDSGSVDAAGNQVILCTPCGALIEKQARRAAEARVRKLREELGQQIAGLQGEVAYLRNRIEHGR